MTTKTQAPAEGDAPPLRLTDAQWTNIVNHQSVIEKSSIEDAVAAAVRLTEARMAMNAKCQPQPKGTEPGLLNGVLLEPLTEEQVFRALKAAGPINSSTVRTLARYWQTHPLVAMAQAPAPAYVGLTDKNLEDVFDAVVESTEWQGADELGRNLVAARAVIAADRALQAKTPAPAQQSEVEQLRSEQAAAVMPMIGPLLDAWDGMCNDFKAEILDEAPDIAKYLSRIGRAMGGEEVSTAQPEAAKPGPAQAPAVAPGHKVTPYEPTQEMIGAVKRFDPALPLEHIRAIWWAMWGAYKPPVQGNDK